VYINGTQANCAQDHSVRKKLKNKKLPMQKSLLLQYANKLLPMMIQQDLSTTNKTSGNRSAYASLCQQIIFLLRSS